MGSIALIGLPGSGKTTLGRMLAQALQKPFYDLDEVIERESGRSIPALFEIGEPYFRSIESQVTIRYAGRDAVLSCGGGVVLCPKNVKALREGGLVLFIDRPVEQILLDIDPSGRPLLAGGRERLLTLNEERRPLYAAAAHATILNKNGPGAALHALLEAVNG